MTRAELIQMVAIQVWKSRDPKMAIGDLISELDRSHGPRGQAARRLNADNYGAFERSVLRLVEEYRR